MSSPQRLGGRFLTVAELQKAKMRTLELVALHRQVKLQPGEKKRIEVDRKTGVPDVNLSAGKIMGDLRVGRRVLRSKECEFSLQRAVIIGRRIPRQAS